MTELLASNQLAGATRLWRYLSLDKLVDLLSTSELFFSPLATFVKSDPFEGYLPAAAIDAHAEIFHKTTEWLKKSWENSGHPFTSEQEQWWKAKLCNLGTSCRSFFDAIAKAIVVNCWHANDSESEAMWRLYTDSGKGVAIETTLDALKESIQARDSGHRVHIYPVKYLNFFDKTLQPRDCVVEGHLAPLLKRISYQHEHEVRAFIGRIPATLQESADIGYWTPAPIRLPIDIKALVRLVHISPYASEPFPSSVTTVCKTFGLETGVIQPSKLLSGAEELLDRLAL